MIVNSNSIIVEIVGILGIQLQCSHLVSALENNFFFFSLLLIERICFEKDVFENKF